MSEGWKKLGGVSWGDRTGMRNRLACFRLYWSYVNGRDWIRDLEQDANGVYLGIIYWVDLRKSGS